MNLIPELQATSGIPMQCLDPPLRGRPRHADPRGDDRLGSNSHGDQGGIYVAGVDCAVRFRIVG